MPSELGTIACDCGDVVTVWTNDGSLYVGILDADLDSRAIANLSREQAAEVAVAILDGTQELYR